MSTLTIILLIYVIFDIAADSIVIGILAHHRSIKRFALTFKTFLQGHQPYVDEGEDDGDAYNDGYEDGFSSGYDQGYDDAMNEVSHETE